MRRFFALALQSLAILALAVVLTTLVLEVWARAQPRRFFLQFDEDLGFALEPGAEGEYRGRWMLARNPGIRTPVRINALGMRGPERTVVKPEGTRRLMILGDSFVQSLEVPWEETFYALLEGQTAAAGAAPLEAFPMGVSGYGQAQQLLWLQRDGLALAPDLVMLVVFLRNDVTDNSAAISPGRARPYFELVDGELRQASAPSQAGRWKYEAASSLRSFIIYKEIGNRIEPLRQLAHEMGLLNYVDNKRIRDPRLPEKRQAAYELTLALVEEIARTSRKAGARFLVAFHGSYPTGTDETTRQRVARFCAGTDLDCMDLETALAGNDEYLIPNDEHWTPAGHRRVAELVWDHWREALVASAEPADRDAHAAR